MKQFFSWVTSTSEWMQTLPLLALLTWSIWFGRNELKTSSGYLRCAATMTCTSPTPSSKPNPQHSGHQLDVILARAADLKNVFHICFYHNAVCDTDHFLGCCKITLQPKKLHCTKQ